MKWASIMAALLISTGARAEGDSASETVQDLYQHCTVTGCSDIAYGFCLGYIAGVTEARTFHAVGTKRICDMDATYGAAKQAFINWAAKHPEHWTESMYDGVMATLDETWPCRKR